MIPHTYPSVSASGEPSKVVVFELASVAGLVAWKDYIPCAVKAAPAASKRNKTDDDGWMGFHILASSAGLTAWIDYIPIDTIAYAAGKQWKTNADGFIPYVDETA